MALAIQMAMAQELSPIQSDGLTIQGIVVDAGGKPVGDALVRLEQQDVPSAREIRTNAAGVFAFSLLKAGSYKLRAEKSGLRSQVIEANALLPSGQQMVRLVLEDSRAKQSGANPSSSNSNQTMEFADKPDFTIAGITDWTAAGGHGSDSNLRASEALVRETVTLKPDAPSEKTTNPESFGSGTDEDEGRLREAVANAPGNPEPSYRLGAFYLREGRYSEAIPPLKTAANLEPGNQSYEYNLAVACKVVGDFSQAREHLQKLMVGRETADLHRLMGEVDEKLGDPLAAVHEFEQAVRMDPSEQNYFEWGSELLVHRAIWQAQEIFQRGAKAYSKSERMLAALGAALFAGALYEEAALRFCDASDLNPGDPEPYVFMGKIEMAAPTVLTCVESRLERFHERQPENATANYLYAVALLKERGKSADAIALQQVEALLTKAVTLDPKCSDAYLQLGILHSSQNDYGRAAGFYEKAIEINPQLADAHYRLGVAYDRIGEREKANREFQVHDEIKKSQAAAVEQERREIKQFLVVLPSQEITPAVPLNVPTSQP
ncbi:MAG: tetratricopeptide repeat protein [Terracidiphilus sp.]|jgi:tetratricopeptide (TPR) repeat protein